MNNTMMNIKLKGQMTIRELIEVLQKVDPDLTWYGYDGEVTGIGLKKNELYVGFISSRGDVEFRNGR